MQKPRLNSTGLLPNGNQQQTQCKPFHKLACAAAASCRLLIASFAASCCCALRTASTSAGTAQEVSCTAQRRFEWIQKREARLRYLSAKCTAINHGSEIGSWKGPIYQSRPIYQWQSASSERSGYT